MFASLVWAALLPGSVALLSPPRLGSPLSVGLPPAWEWSRVEVAESVRPAARQGHAAVEVGQSIYMFGGCVQAARCYNDVWIFDTDSLRWRQAPITGEWPEARAGHSATLVGTDIFIYGGANIQETFSGVYRLDLVKQHWTLAAPDIPAGGAVPGRRTNHAAALDAQGRIFVFGGYNMDGQFLNDMWVLCVGGPTPNAWKAHDLLRVGWLKPDTTGTLPEPRESHTMTIVDRKLIVFGGYGASGRALNDLHVYDLDGLSWSVPELCGAPPPPRQGHSAVRHGHELVVAGGCDVEDERPICQSDVWSLDLKLMRWAPRSTDSITWLPREGHTATFVRGQMFVFGGCLLGVECYNDVAALDTHTPCPASCGGHGECVRTCDVQGQCAQDSFCRCMAPGFSGHDCMQPVTCLEDCGPHGTCGQNGHCQCENGWAGAGCATELPCPGSPKCSSQGLCLANGTCHCLAGFIGPDCGNGLGLLQQEVECPGGCCGRGTCMAGACECSPGWYGPTCALNPPTWEGLQRQWLAAREKLVQEARTKREQALKSQQVADTLVRATLEQDGGPTNALAEIMQLRRDSHALAAEAASAEERAAAGSLNKVAEMMSTTCDSDYLAASLAAASLPASVMPPVVLMAKASRVRDSLQTAWNDLPPSDSPALPMAQQRDHGTGAAGFGIGHVLVGHEHQSSSCAGSCSFQGVCKHGVCFCQPGYSGEACSAGPGGQAIGTARAVAIAAAACAAAVGLTFWATSSKP